jgi:hypothetical protein
MLTCRDIALISTLICRRIRQPLIRQRFSVFATSYFSMILKYFAIELPPIAATLFAAITIFIAIDFRDAATFRYRRRFDIDAEILFLR